MTAVLANEEVFENVKVLIGTSLVIKVTEESFPENFEREDGDVTIIDQDTMNVGYLELESTGDGQAVMQIGITQNVQNTTVDEVIERIESLMENNQIFPNNFLMGDEMTGLCYRVEVVSVDRSCAIDINGISY